MSNIRCDSCLGAKQVLGLGLIMRDCEVCEGIGYVKEEQKFENSQKNGEVKQFRRRGRPDPAPKPAPIPEPEQEPKVASSEPCQES